jgi:hypothetical protein
MANNGPEMLMKWVSEMVLEEPDRIHIGFAAPADCTVLDPAVLHVVARKRWHFLFKI